MLDELEPEDELLAESSPVDELRDELSVGVDELSPRPPLDSLSFKAQAMIPL